METISDRHMKERPPGEGPDESGQGPKFSRAESLPEEKELLPAGEAPDGKPKRGLRLVSGEKEKLTLDQRRAERSKMSSAILEENWKIELADLEEKEAEFVRSNVIERIASGSLDHRAKDKRISLRERFDRFMRKRTTEAQKQQDIKEVLYDDWLEKLEEEMVLIIDDYLVERLPRIKNVLPELNLEFFASKIGDIMSRTEKVLAAPKVGRQLDEKDFVRVNMLKKEMRVLKEMFLFAVNEEANRKFDPLLSRARGDVRMFLVGHINRAGLSPEDAQRFLQEKQAVKSMFIFLPEMEEREGKDGETKKFFLGLMDSRDSNIWINLERLSLLEDGRIDEAQLATTAIHELVHTVSTKGPDKKLGLSRYEELFKGVARGKEIYTANDYLNELGTELLALEIASKYYKPDAPGTIKLGTSKEQKFVGYADMIRAFAALEGKYGSRVRELKDILISVMVRGNYDALRSFLEDNEGLFAEVRDICARSASQEVME
jgi:hypothetical protein